MADYSKMPVKLKPASTARRLRLSSYVNVSALAVPEAFDYAKNVKAWPMFLNDRIGCCGIAGPAHQVQAWTMSDDDSPDFTPTDSQIEHEYGVYGGYPKQDGGVVLLDVLKGWQSRGMFGGRKIEAFVGVNPKDDKLTKAAIWLFGGLCIGLRMPAHWQSMEDWRAPTSSTRDPNWAPDSWGGHCVEIVKYDAEWLYAVTWGAIKRISWNAYRTYCDESFAMVSTDFTGKNGVSSSNHVRLRSLLADVQNIQAGRPLVGEVEPNIPTTAGVPWYVSMACTMAGFKINTPAKDGDLFSVGK
jgi:hypothetical protein